MLGGMAIGGVNRRCREEVSLWTEFRSMEFVGFSSHDTGHKVAGRSIIHVTGQSQFWKIINRDALFI